MVSAGDHCFRELKIPLWEGKKWMECERAKRNSNPFFQRDALGRGKTKSSGSDFFCFALLKMRKTRHCGHATCQGESPGERRAEDKVRTCDREKSLRKREEGYRAQVKGFS